MSLTSANKIFQNFVGGLITEAGPLSFPEGSSSDEDNMIPDNTLTRRRRLGMDYEDNAVISSETIGTLKVQHDSIDTFVWDTVAHLGGLNYLVVQISNILYFYDLSETPLSSGKKTFEIDLTSFLIPGETEVGIFPVVMDSGDGLLFVTSIKIRPFYVEYTELTDSITATEIQVTFRDFEGLDDLLEPEERPTTLTDEHEYNLKNQGWLPPVDGGSDPITAYQAAKTKYPSNNKQWWAAKDASNVFSPTELDKLFLGNTQTTRGHYVLDALFTDRTNASGVGSFASIDSDIGFRSTAHFASRVWYVLNSKVYYSQLIESNKQLGKCYQEFDPTSEDLNELLETDGGVIPIPEMSGGKAFFVSGNSIIVYADNGIWSVSGSVGSGFTPTDFYVDKISDIGLASVQSLVDVEGTPIWWSRTGIYTVGRSETTDRLTTQSLTRQTIQTYYDDTIPTLAKGFATGTYDPLTRQVIWLWKDSDDSSFNHLYDRALILDTKTGGYYPVSFKELATNSPCVSSGFSVGVTSRITEVQNVVDSSFNQVIDSNLDDVVADIDTLGVVRSFLKFLTLIPQGDNTYEFTFSSLRDTTFEDWATAGSGTGIDAVAYMTSGPITEGDLTGDKSTPYIFTYMDQSDNSSALMSVRWDWRNSGDSGRWSKKRQIYRNTRGNEDVIISRNVIRGHGKALQYRIDTEAGADLRLAGWAVKYNVTTDI